MVFAQVVQQANACQQARKGFTLVQRPGQPGCNPQILGLSTQQGLSDLLHFQPVDLAAFMHRLCFGQLIFQCLELARKSNVLAGKTLFANSRLSER
ncbi:hypothetical protein D3C77_502190 [compost metagenome]